MMPSDATEPRASGGRSAEPQLGRGVQLGRLLGRGAMGHVWSVSLDADNAGAVPLAAKVLEQEGLRRAFVQEYAVARSVSHPGFPRAHALRHPPTGDAPFALYERCDGLPLDVRVPEGPEEHVALAADLFRALDHLHRLGWVHGDLSPKHVLRGADDHSAVKLLDLGAAGRQGSGAGATSGTLAWCAPERLAGEPYAVAADLWSAGAVLFALAHGRPPFPGYPGRPAEGAPARGEAPPHPLDPLLDRLLAPCPQERPPSAAAALAALVELTGGEARLVPPRQLAARFEQPPFVDVGEVLRRLVDSCLEAVRAPGAGEEATSRLVRIGGEPGSGRSRLLSELHDRLVGEGLQVVQVAALPHDAPGAAVARLLTAAGASVDTPSSGGDAASGARALIACAETLSAGPGQGVAWMIDDSQWLDPVSRRALAGWARAAVDAQGAGQVVAVLAGEHGDLRLPEWQADHAVALMAQVVPGRRISARQLAPWVRRTAGRIGLLLDRLAEAAHTGELTVDAAAVHLAPGDSDSLGDVDAALTAAAARRLSDLSEDAVDAARRLALARTALPAEVVGDGVAALVARGLARRIDSPTADPVVALVSDATRRAALAGAAPEHGHGQLADQLAAWARDARDAGRADDAQVWTIEATWHALEARRPGADAAALAFIRQGPPARVAPLLSSLVSRPDPPWTGAADRCAAADTARAVGAAALARTLLEGAAEGAQAGPEAAGVWARLGDLESSQSRHLEARHAYSMASEQVGEHGPGGLRARIATGLAKAAVLGGQLDDADAHVAEGLELMGALRDASPEEALGLQGRLGYVQGLVAFYRGDLDGARRALDDALADTRASAQPAEEAAVVTALGLVAHRRGALRVAAARYREALSLGDSLGDDARVLTALQNLGVVQHAQADFAGALATYRQAHELAHALQQPGRRVQIAGNLGNLLLYLGDVDGSATVLDDGLAAARRQDNRFVAGAIRTLQGEVARSRHDPAAAEAAFDEARALAEASGSVSELVEARLGLARTALDGGRPESARRHAATAWALAEGSTLGGLAAQAAALEALASVREVHADLPHAETKIAWALERAGQIGNPDRQWPLHLAAAEVAQVGGRWADAKVHASEVRRRLRGLEDAVPGRAREAFRVLVERRDAARAVAWESAVTVGGPAGDADDPRWGRLLEINKRLSGEHDVDRLLEYIMDSAILLAGAERGFLLLATDTPPDADAAEVNVRVARNLDQENLRRTRLKISHGIARRVIDRAEPELTVDAMEDDRYQDQLSVHDLRLRSILCVPMTLRGVAVGAIYLDNRFRAGAFGRKDLAFMEAFADQAALALDTARLLSNQASVQAELEAAREKVETLNAQLRDELKSTKDALEDTHRVVIRQQRQLASQHQYSNIIGESAPMRSVFAVIDRVLDAHVPVLITGESGTGKELVARAIHFNGTRRDEPFVTVNCGAIPANLLESELFGHVRGAFTGATSDKRGLFEVADKGTLLLDELGELPLEMQVKLLRVLQSGEIQKVGATRERVVDVRVLAATNRRLDEEVTQGRFREDLYYRLSVIPVRLPALRERKGDIPLLVRHFLARNAADGLGHATRVSRKAMTLLERFSWPGNVRQLEMVLKNASLFADGDVLEPEDFNAFPDLLRSRPTPRSSAALSGRRLQDIEREAIIQALQDNRGNKKRSAEQLGIDRRTLYNKLAAYQIVIEKDLKVR